MRQKITLLATLCVSASLILIGCEQSGPAAGEASAETASATKNVSSDAAITVEKTPAAAEKSAATKTESTKSKPASTASADGGPDPTHIDYNDLAAGLTNPGDAKPIKRANFNEDNVAGELTVRAEPEALDLGEIPTGDAKTGIVKLVNFGSEAVKVVDCKSSCGCTAAKCPRNKIIEPGQSVDVEIKMSAGNKPQTITKVMRFMIEGQPQLPLSVSSQAVSYVLAEPWTIDKDKDEAEGRSTGTVTLNSKDEVGFRVLRMHPPIVEDFGSDSLAKHEINLDWERWEELGSTRRLTFYTDHPKCDKIFVNVQAIYKPVNRGNQVAQNNNTNPAVPTQTGGALKPVDGREFNPPKPEYIQPANNALLLIKNGNADKLIELIDSGEVDLEEQDRTGATLLALAAHNGQLEIVSQLVALGADVEARDRIGKTPLMWAGHAKDVNIIRELLNAGADIRARDSVVGTALSWTAGFGDGASVRTLIEAGSDVNVGGTMGFTPLIWAALTGEAESVTALLEAGADAEVKDMTPAGSTPLMHASQTGNADNVKALIEHGAKIEATDREGKTALLVASEKSGGDLKTVKTLVEAGADITATDLRGRNALDLAQMRTDPRSSEVLEYLESLLTNTESDKE